MPRWPKTKEAEVIDVKKETKGIKGIVPFTTRAELPKCITRINKQGEEMFVKYGEARYLLRRCDAGYSFLKIYKKVTSTVTRGIRVYRRKSNKDMAVVRKLREAGIPVIGD